MATLSRKLDGRYQGEAEYWWLEFKHLTHRRSAGDVHDLLVHAQEKLGTAWMTIDHVLAVMEADDPAAVVQAWIASSGSRRCEACHGKFTPNSPAQKYCENCRDMTRRKGSRERMRRSRARRRAEVAKLTTENPMLTGS